MRPNPFGEEYQKYWDRMPVKFSKFEEGIQTDLEGIYSTGPEEASKKVAKKTNAKTVVDGFCGIGGSTIGYAYYADKVYAIDNNAERLEMAKHNVSIYGFTDKVEFIHGDFLVEAPKLNAEAVFIDPPWGGPSYADLEKFSFEHFSPNGKEVLDVAFAHYDKVVMRLPKNFDVSELEQFGKKYMVDEEMFQDNVIFRIAYFGI